MIQLPILASRNNHEKHDSLKVEKVVSYRIKYIKLGKTARIKFIDK